MGNVEPPAELAPEIATELAVLQAGCRTLGITLDPAWHDAILFNLRVIAAQSQALILPALPDESEPGPVFAA